MTYTGGGSFQSRPGILSALGDHKRRIVALERRKQPSAGAGAPTGVGDQIWLTGGYRGAVFAPGSLLGYYRLGDAPNTLVDQVAPTVNLTKHTGAVPGANAAGPPQIGDGDDGYTNTALATQDGDYFVMGVSGANKYGSLSKYSISLWIWPNSTQVALNSASPAINRAWIFSDRVDNFGSRIGWALVADYALADGFGGANVGLGLMSSAGDTITLGPYAMVGGGIPALAASWYHVAITHDDTTQVTRIYVNGALVGTDVSSGFSWQSTLTGGLGALIGAGFPIDVGGTNRQRGFVGTIDEVAIYSKVLSQSDVLLLYNGSGPDTDTGRWIGTGYSAGAPVGTGAVDTAQIADRAVTTAKLADSSVTSAKIADGTIVAVDISATLKPSGGAAAGTESLRALGTTASTAMAGNDPRIFGKAALTYSASITPNAALGGWETITPTNATAFTINAPSNAPAATSTQELTIEISNASGGALGVITWNAAFVFTNGAFVAPVNTKKRFVTFGWNGAVWVEQCRANADY